MKLALLLTVIAFLIDPAISAGFEYLENGGRYLINAFNIFGIAWRHEQGGR